MEAHDEGEDEMTGSGAVQVPRHDRVLVPGNGGVLGYHIEEASR